MSRNLIISLIVSLLLHCSFFLGGEILKTHPNPKLVTAETPTVQLMPLPPVEPDKSDEVREPGETADISAIVPPMLVDIPSISDSSFTQQIQPPLPSSMTRPTGVIFIPQGRLDGGFGSGFSNVFDLANLDKNPEPVFKQLPVYPFDLRRAGIKGQVTVEFMVDSNGNVRDPHIVSSSNRGFDNAVLEGVLKWKFSPGKKGGVAVTTRSVTLPFKFQ